MRILFCSPTFKTITHGPAKFAQLIHEINQIYPEHHVRILTEGPPLEDCPGVEGIRIYCPRLLHALINFFRAIQYHRRASQLIKQFPFDVIVYNNAILGIWSAIRWKDRIPVVGLLTDDENLRISWRPDPDKPFRKWLIRLLFRYFERLSIRRMTATIVCSDFLRMETISKYGIIPSKISRLYQTVKKDSYSFNPNKAFHTKEVISLLFVKNDYERGGLWILFEALKRLTSYSFELIIIGPGRQNESRIVQRAKEGANANMRFLGPQSQEVVKDYLAQCDILCIPALREGLGVANIEGLAAGIPVVSTNAGGIPEVLGQGKYGWLAEAGDPISLAKTLNDCIISPRVRKQKSIEGRKFVERQFDHRRMLEEFIEILSGFSTN